MVRIRQINFNGYTYFNWLKATGLMSTSQGTIGIRSIFGGSSSLEVNWLKKWPGRFPGIAGNAGNHRIDGKFHESNKILNQI